MIACFPVYRSYIADEGVHDADRRYIETAVRRATARNPLLSRPRLPLHPRHAAAGATPESSGEEDRAEQRRFAGKFQQVTAPVTAKGVEDTAFYVYNRLAVAQRGRRRPGPLRRPPRGGAPLTTASRQAHWPYALSPLSTHDTKRSEDVRARINVLSEMPRGLGGRASRAGAGSTSRTARSSTRPAPPTPTRSTCSTRRCSAPGRSEPYGPEEYAAFVKRIQAYMLKALHEAKVHTSWINPNAEYDEAIRRVRRPHPRRGAQPPVPATTSAPSSGGSATSACSTRCRRRC